MANGRKTRDALLSLFTIVVDKGGLSWKTLFFGRVNPWRYRCRTSTAPSCHNLTECDRHNEWSFSEVTR